MVHFHGVKRHHAADEAAPAFHRRQTPRPHDEFYGFFMEAETMPWHGFSSAYKVGWRLVRSRLDGTPCCCRKSSAGEHGAPVGGGVCSTPDDEGRGGPRRPHVRH